MGPDPELLGNPFDPFKTLKIEGWNRTSHEKQTHGGSGGGHISPPRAMLTPPAARLRGPSSLASAPPSSRRAHPSLPRLPLRCPRPRLAAIPTAALERDLTGETVVVVGLGASGRAAARLALARGAHVVGVDANAAAQALEADPRVAALAAAGGARVSTQARAPREPRAVFEMPTRRSCALSSLSLSSHSLPL